MKYISWPKLITVLFSALLLSNAGVVAVGAEEVPFQAVVCQGEYPRHLQGVCTDGSSAIYWSWTVSLVKTDTKGNILAEVPVDDHGGDLCYHDGLVYVAVNLGRFNRPEGQADNWIYVYDGETLDEVARHPVPEVVHGAGGIAYHDGKFIVVGGLPRGMEENYLYEYDEDFNFQKRHVLPSGYTRFGIQTAAYADGYWWFGCYGRPQDTVLQTDEDFRLIGQWDFDAALGIEPIPGGRFLIGKNTGSRSRGYRGWTVIAKPDPENGLVYVTD